MSRVTDVPPTSNLIDGLERISYVGSTFVLCGKTPVSVLDPITMTMKSLKHQLDFN
jgi:hypothetical protein